MTNSGGEAFCCCPNGKEMPYYTTITTEACDWFFNKLHTKKHEVKE